MSLDHTHDPARRSWVATANIEGGDFPIQNLPLGVVGPAGGEPRCGVAIGESVLDLRAAAADGLIHGEIADAVAGGSFDALFAMGRDAVRMLRHDAFALLDDQAERRREDLLHPIADCTFHLPTTIRSFTDFFVGIHHAVRCGEIINGPDYALPPNYHYMPLAYNGRASTVSADGGPLRRPHGLRKRLAQDAEPSFGPSRWLDFELEMGFFMGPGNAPGEPIPIAEAGERIIGFCLLNDWSARDIQMFEMAPLGAFNGKSSGTAISPWIVTADALEPFRSPAMERFADAPPLPPYLLDERDQRQGGLDVALSATIRTEAMRQAGHGPAPLLRTHARYLYWTCAQMVAQHSVSGCSLVPGDLIGTGTVSGPTRADLASFFELSFAGREPITLANGERRAFIEDGDEIAFSGRCTREGFVSIGFGSCAGRVAPAFE